MKNKALISIIVPVYNGEKYLKPCLDTLINQTMKEVEIILINDGSKDNSLQILKEYAKNDNRIVLIDKANEGQGKARNIAIKQAKGKYIMFVDCDDLLELNACEVLYKKIETTKSDLVMFNFYEFSDDGKEFKEVDIINSFIVRNKASDLRIWDDKFFTYLRRESWYKIYNKDFLINNNIFFEDQYGWEDLSLWLDICLKNPKISLIYDKLYKYRVLNSTSSSKNWSKHYKNLFIVFQKNIKKIINVKMPNNYSYISALYKWLKNWVNVLDTKKHPKAKRLFKQQKKWLKQTLKNTPYNSPKFLADLFSEDKCIIKKTKLFGLTIFKKKKYPNKTKYYFLGIKVYNKKKKRYINNNINVGIRKKEYIKPTQTYKTLICTQGYGHSGSGAVLAYLSEFSNTSVVGFQDAGFSKKLNDQTNSSFEIEFLRYPGGLFHLESFIESNNNFIKDYALKMFITLSEWYYYSGHVVYNDEYMRLTREFIDSLIDYKIPTPNGFEFSWFLAFKEDFVHNYSNFEKPLIRDTNKEHYLYVLKKMTKEEFIDKANKYITSFLSTIESKEFLVLDQMIQDCDNDLDKKIKYCGDLKNICVWRDPRDIYATGLMKKELWIPQNPKDFVKWFLDNRGFRECLQTPHPNKLVIRFEDLVINPHEVTAQVNKFLGLDVKNHINKQQFFTPELSKQNIGLWKKLPNKEDVTYIYNQLQEYCYEGEK